MITHGSKMNEINTENFNSVSQVVFLNLDEELKSIYFIIMLFKLLM